jgi:hypothetical protein
MQAMKIDYDRWLLDVFNGKIPEENTTTEG